MVSLFMQLIVHWTQTRSIDRSNQHNSHATLTATNGLWLTGNTVWDKKWKNLSFGATFVFFLIFFYYFYFFKSDWISLLSNHMNVHFFLTYPTSLLFLFFFFFFFVFIKLSPFKVLLEEVCYKVFIFHLFSYGIYCNYLFVYKPFSSDQFQW